MLRLCPVDPVDLRSGLLLRFDLFQRFGKLIRTGSWLEATGGSFQSGNHIVHLHASYQLRDSFGISIASAHELNRFYRIAVNFYFNCL